MTDVRLAEFVSLLTDLDDEKREAMLQRALLMASNNTPDEQMGYAPSLLSAGDLVQQRAIHAERAEELMRQHYGDDIRRLAAADVNAAAAREYVAIELARKLPISVGDAEELITRVAGGGSADPFTCLDSADETPEEPPTWLIDRRICKGMLHQFHGKPGTNKTTRVLEYMLRLASEQKHVVLIEYEMGKQSLKAKIRELGYDREKIRPYFHDIALNHPFDRDTIEAALTRWPETEVLALDNTSEAVTSNGGDSNSDTDTIRVLGLLRDLAHHRAVTTITIDHPPHSRGDSARGSSAKEQIIDIGFKVETPDPVRRDAAGTQLLTCVKDRPSYIGLGQQFWSSVGDGEGNLPFKDIEAPTKSGLWSADERKIIDALSAHAESNPNASNLSQNATLIASGLSKGTGTLATLERLANDDRAPVVRETATRGSQTQFLYGYRAVEDVDGLAF